MDILLRKTDNSYVRDRINRGYKKASTMTHDEKIALLQAKTFLKRASDKVTTPAPAETEATPKTGEPLKADVLKLVNDQYMKEAYSAEIYYVMSAYFADIKLEGFAKFFRKQAEEERTHAMKFFDYLIKCNIMMKPMAFPSATPSYSSPAEACKFFLEHEHEVTGLIQAIADTAFKAKDFYTFEFIQWFLKEQLEEVRRAEDLSKKMSLVAGDMAGLLILDEQLGG